MMASVAAAGAAAPDQNQGAGDLLRMLPRELLALALSALPVEDRLKASRTSRAWQQAALDPPYSTSITVAVLVDSASVCERGEPAARPSADWDERTLELRRRAVPPAEAARALQSAACAGVERLRVVALRLSTKAGEGGDEDEDEAEACAGAVEAVLAAARPGVLRLELAAPGGDGSALEAIAARVGAGLRGRFPRLVELYFALDAGGDPDAAVGRTVRLSSLSAVPAHPTLRVLGAHLTRLAPAGERWADVPARLPALRRVHGLSEGVHLGAGEEAAGPAALAAAGVRAACVALFYADLSTLPRARAAAALLALVDRDRPRPDGPQVLLCETRLPDGWPNGGACLAGLRWIALQSCCLRPPVLGWLFGGPHLATLRTLDLTASRHKNVAPGGVLEALRRLPAGVRVVLRCSERERRAYEAGLAACPHLSCLVQVE